MHLESRRFITTETLISQHNGQSVTHSLDNCRKETLPRRNILEQNAAFEVVALVDKVIDGKGVEQPCANSALIHIVGIGNSVAPCAFVVLDIDVEHILDGVLVTVERTFGIVVARLVVLRPHPVSVDFFERNAALTGSENIVHQPYITVKKICCHNLPVLRDRKDSK